MKFLCSFSYEWWIILVIIIDIIIILLLIILITCCLWRRCPLYYKRNELKQREYLWKGRRHSSPEHSYYIGQAEDLPVERANIAMPGFGAPMVPEGDVATVLPRSNYALAGVTGYVQPSIYSQRYHLDGEEDQRSVGRFSWRSRVAPRRYRTVYDIQGDHPDDDDPYY